MKLSEWLLQSKKIPKVIIGSFANFWGSVKDYIGKGNTATIKPQSIKMSKKNSTTAKPLKISTETTPLANDLTTLKTILNTISSSKNEPDSFSPSGIITSQSLLDNMDSATRLLLDPNKLKQVTNKNDIIKALMTIRVDHKAGFKELEEQMKIMDPHSANLTTPKTPDHVPIGKDQTYTKSNNIG